MGNSYRLKLVKIFQHMTYFENGEDFDLMTNFFKLKSACNVIAKRTSTKIINYGKYKMNREVC